MPAPVPMPRCLSCLVIAVHLPRTGSFPLERWPIIRRCRGSEGESDMAARPTWKGFLKISLVNIPVRVFPATDSAATISFNQLHAECQTRIQQKRWCPTLRARSADVGDRQGLRVREGPLRRDDRRGHLEGPAGIDARHRSRAVRRRDSDRSDLRRAAVLPRARRRRWPPRRSR